MKCNKCISQLACERDLWKTCHYREDNIAEEQKSKDRKDMCDILITIIALVTLTCVVREIVGSI